MFNKILNMNKHKLMYNTYPDGTGYYTFPSDYDESTITFKINSYGDLWRLNQLVDAANDMGFIPEILIPNLLDAQADRRFGKGTTAGLKLVLDLLNSMHANFKVFHPHNPEIIEMYSDNIEIIDNSYFISTVINELDDEIDNTILLAPDAGSYKPLMKTASNISWKNEILSASKARMKDGTIAQLLPVEDFYGKNILIVDDLCVFGGTFKGLATALRNANVGKLYLAVSHMTVNNLGTDPVTNYFDKVFTTNSKYEIYRNADHEELNKLEIIKLF